MTQSVASPRKMSMTWYIWDGNKRISCKSSQRHTVRLLSETETGSLHPFIIGVPVWCRSSICSHGRDQFMIKPRSGVHFPSFGIMIFFLLTLAPAPTKEMYIIQHGVFDMSFYDPAPLVAIIISSPSCLWALQVRFRDLSRNRFRIIRDESGSLPPTVYFRVGGSSSQLLNPRKRSIFSIGIGHAFVAVPAHLDRSSGPFCMPRSLHVPPPQIHYQLHSAAS